MVVDLTRCALNHDAAFLPQVTLSVPCAPETTEWCCWPARVWRSWKHILITDGMRSRHIIMVALPEDTYIFFSCVLRLRGDTRWSKPLQLGSIPNHIYLLSCAQSQGGPSHRAKQRVWMQHRSPPCNAKECVLVLLYKSVKPSTSFKSRKAGQMCCTCWMPLMWRGLYFSCMTPTRLTNEKHHVAIYWKKKRRTDKVNWFLLST